MAGEAERNMNVIGPPPQKGGTAQLSPEALQAILAANPNLAQLAQYDMAEQKAKKQAKIPTQDEITTMTSPSEVHPGVDVTGPPDPRLLQMMGISPQTSPELQPAVDQAGGPEALVGQPGTMIGPNRQAQAPVLAVAGQEPQASQAPSARELAMGPPVQVTFVTKGGRTRCVYRAAFENETGVMLLQAPLKEGSTGFEPNTMEPFDLLIGGKSRRMVYLGQVYREPDYERMILLDYNQALQALGLTENMVNRMTQWLKEQYNEEQQL
jgi:hypothetical protein